MQAIPLSVPNKALDAANKSLPINTSACGNEYNSAVSPLYGYGISHPQRGDIISKLFQKTASELCEKYYQNLQVSIYAHDSEVLWHYILGSFIMELTDVVRDTDSLISTKPCQYAFKEISKSELLNHKQNVIEFYRNLINHLRLSPVFYPCHEFLPIEDRFTDFLADDIRVFAAFDGENVIGMVISEASDIWPGLNEKNAVNLSDLFVAPAYRGNGIAAALLDFTSNALKKSGIKKIYVTHGTVNPTAVGFWDKYFSNYAYRFSRQIDSEMLGVIKPVQNDNCISRRII